MTPRPEALLLVGLEQRFCDIGVIVKLIEEREAEQ
jgi:hypothetical protein